MIYSSSLFEVKYLQDDTSTDPKKALKKYPNYWEKRKIDKKKHYWFKIVEEKQKDFERAVDVVASINHQQQVILFAITQELPGRSQDIYICS